MNPAAAHLLAEFEAVVDAMGEERAGAECRAIIADHLADDIGQAILEYHAMRIVSLDPGEYARRLLKSDALRWYAIPRLRASGELADFS